MSYPVILLTRPWRRAILVGLIALFFVISPLIILYTAGYRYDWNTHRIKATGVISIDVSPADTLVTLSGTPITEPTSRLPFFSRDTTSYELKNRAPGTYTLSLTHPGYHSWFKDIRVESNQTTYIRDVRLIPQTLPIKLTSIPDGITEASVSPSGRYILLIGLSDELSNAYIYDTNLERTELVIRDAEHIRDAAWSPLYDDVVLTMSASSSERIVYLGERNAFTPVTTVRTKSTTSTTAWPHPNDRTRDRFFVRDATTIFAATSITSTPIARSSSTAWYIDREGDIWSVEEGVFVRSHNDTPIERVSLLTDSLDGIFTIEPWYVLVQKNHDLFLLTRTDTPSKTFPDVSQVVPLPNEQGFLIASGSELWRLTRDGTPSLITRLGTPIQSITPLPLFSSMVTYAGGEITTIREDDLVSTILFTEPIASPLFLTHNGTHLSFLFAAGPNPPQLYTLPLEQ